jgi:hypothetical protein
MQPLDNDAEPSIHYTDAERRLAMGLFNGLLGLPLIWFFADFCESLVDLWRRLA